jgi:AraC-like DNA-binding protein
MSRIELVSIESCSFRGGVSEWSDALSAHVGHMPLSSWDKNLTSCVPIGQQDFSGRIEFGELGNLVLAKVATSTPHDLTFSLGSTPPEAALPLVLLLQTSGSCHLKEHKFSCTLRPDDWCLVDTSYPFHISSPGVHNENLSLRLERPSDPELLALLARGTARRWSGTTGASRILTATVRETFNQMHCLRQPGVTGLERAITGMVWDAVRERLEAPSRLGHQDLQRARIKAFIDSRLDDPELSVNAIYEACGISVRSIHRAFGADSAGSVSNYIWMRRLSRCAAELRVPQQGQRPITEICFSWGFNSSSHFSRLFKEQFGVTPRDYKLASASGAWHVRQ